ncbi:hypothetical protein IV203_034252 [Nitzschia inconspicua]|uniref:Uncharacterized protein n=1 Tax=Nitzschia inconspicua TaxID=303405 RepID=A0A9K3Q760_9STRA|nr:hypothetical protein IV203_034252 [Nitzschia inconspicua]
MQTPAFRSATANQTSANQLDDFACPMLNDYKHNDSAGRIVSTKSRHRMIMIWCRLPSMSKQWSPNIGTTTISNNIPPYVAPYFFLVQSSGMGKTKLLYEERNNYSANDFESKLLLISDMPPNAASNERVFDDPYIITRSEGIRPNSGASFSPAPEMDCYPRGNKYGLVSSPAVHQNCIQHSKNVPAIVMTSRSRSAAANTAVSFP